MKISKEIQVELSIDGNMLKTFSRLQIKQAFNAHHSFELVIDHDAMEATGAHTLQSSQDLIGKFITICFGEDPGHNTFKGIITEIGLAQDQGLWGSLVLKGFSPTYLMEGGKHYTSFYARKLSDMLSEASKGLASNDMNIVNKPLHNGQITYMCQYGESNFAFINRLSSEYGEFFYYDGLHLFFGKPSSPNTLDMTYGEQIERMNFAMRMAATNVQHYSYNSKDNQVLNSKLSGSVSGADGYTNKVLDVSGKMFSQTVSQPSPVRTVTKVELDEQAEVHMAKLAAGTVMLTAAGDEPKLKLGTVIKLKVSQKGLGIGHNEHGEYLVTNLTHNITGTGTYSNSFEAIPSSSQAVPFEAPKPLAENQVATVLDNADPEGQGRVRVQMLWQKAKGQQTDWIRVMTGDAGSSGQVSKNRGHVFIPEIGDQVMVGFRYNDPNRPFVLGSLFHGENGAGGGKDNNLKSIKTRSGHTLEFNDTGDGTSITLKDKNGNCIHFDTKGKHITITAPETMTLNAKNMAINVDENMTVKVGKDMKTFVDANHTLDIKEKHEISSNATKESITEDKDLSIKGDLTVSTGTTEFSSKKGDITIHSVGVAVLQGKKDAKVNKG